MKRACSVALILFLLVALSLPAFAENLALKATPESSSDYNPDYAAAMAIDGWVKNAETHRPAWKSDNETAPWLKLDWKKPVDISFMAIYGIPGDNNSIDKGKMEFSDGSKFEFGALNEKGGRTEFDIPAKTGITWVKVSIEGTGVVGLDEIMLFDKKGGTNVALSATATASSTLPDDEGDVKWVGKEGINVPAKAINGFATADLPAGECEWASAGDPFPSLKLTWDSEQTVTAVVLYDRFNGNDNVVAAELTFSDGSKIEVGELNKSALPMVITFDAKKITWLNFEVMESEGPNLGLAEIEVYDILPAKLGGPEETVAPVETAAPEAAANAPAETPTETPAQTPSAPQTSDISSVYIAALALAAALGCAVIKKKAK